MKRSAINQETTPKKNRLRKEVSEPISATENQNLALSQFTEILSVGEFCSSVGISNGGLDRIYVTFKDVTISRYLKIRCCRCRKDDPRSIVVCKHYLSCEACCHISCLSKGSFPSSSDTWTCSQCTKRAPIANPFLNISMPMPFEIQESVASVVVDSPTRKRKADCQEQLPPDWRVQYTAGGGGRVNYVAPDGRVFASLRSVMPPLIAQTRQPPQSAPFVGSAHAMICVTIHAHMHAHANTHNSARLRCRGIPLSRSRLDAATRARAVTGPATRRHRRGRRRPFRWR